jgi:signal transduction histidine kinase
MMGIALPIIFALSFIGYQSQAKILRDQSSNQLLGLNSTKKAHIESFMRQLRTNASLLAEDPRIANAMQELAAVAKTLTPIEDRKRLAAALSKTLPGGKDGSILISENPQFARIQEYGALRQKRLSLPMAPDLQRFEAAWQRHLLPIKAKLRDLQFYDVMLFSAEVGHCVGSITCEPDMGGDVFGGALSLTPHLQAVQGAFKGSTQMVDFQRYIGSNDMPSAFVCVPVRQNGKIIGALSAQLSIDAISKVASGNSGWDREGLGETGETLLIGNDSTLRNDSRFLRGDIAQFKSDLLANGMNPDSVREMERNKTTVLAFPVVTSGMQIAASNNIFVTETQSFRGKKILAAFSNLAVPDLSWQIITKKDLSEIDAPLADLRRLTILFTLLVSLVVTAISLFVARRVTKPINRIIEVARRIADGEVGVRANIEREDELGKLGRMVDHMIERDEHMEDISGGIRRNIVHDLKTPVTVIKGMAETLQMPDVGADPVMREEMLTAISEQSDLLLDDLKDILHPMDERYTPSIEPFDLAILIEKVAKAEKHTGRAANHEIQVFGGDAPVMVEADRRKIRRVVENLLSNAIKYSPGTDKQVTVTIQDTDAQYLQIHFQDEGLGMSAETLEKVLAEGGRVEEHARLGIEGTGLGLGSVRMILQAHGGELLAESELGKGSRFTVILPKRPVVVPA